MKIKESTILITGGSNGIGLEFAKQFMNEGANVIITGRNFAKLQEVKKTFPKIHIFQSDVNNPMAIKLLFEQVTTQFPNLNMIINNAGIMRSVELLDANINMDNLTDEIDTNFTGTVRMIHQFLPHLITKNSAAIINITSGLAYIPFPISPLYCATKAGIHMYSQALRQQLKHTNVKVFEVAPPKTDKPLQTAIEAQHDTGKVMKVEVLVQKSIKGILKNRYEIKPGLASVMKLMSRIAPEFFTKMVAKNVEKAKLKRH
ncbi:SDR family oxidoreductase [Zhouia sp. PK063]|uniref:SDR family oxidoreductase n=1 Tax=Zhouia sp. PK063 TaxID=3373602 RepID=UPI00378E62DF